MWCMMLLLRQTRSCLSSIMMGSGGAACCHSLMTQLTLYFLNTGMGSIMTNIAREPSLITLTTQLTTNHHHDDIPQSWIIWVKYQVLPPRWAQYYLTWNISCHHNNSIVTNLLHLSHAPEYHCLACGQPNYLLRLENVSVIVRGQ